MSPARRILGQSFHRLLWLLAVVLIPLAVVVSVGRELAPMLSAQKPAIERLLLDKTGVSIRIGEVSASWHGLTPTLTLTNIELADPRAPSDTLLSIPRLMTEPEWWASLRDLSPRLRTEIDGLALTLAQNPAGGIEIVELKGLSSSQPEQSKASLRWLFAQPSLALANSALAWQAPNARKQSIQDLTIKQYSRGSDYRAQVEFKLAGKSDLQYGIIRLDGDPLAWQSAPWQLYLKLENLPDWQPWMSLLPSGWQVDLDAGRGELWLSGQGNQPLQATMAVKSLSMRARWPNSNPYTVNDLQAVFTAQGMRDHGQLAFSDVQGKLDGLAIPMQRGHVAWQPDALNVALAGLSISDAYALAKRESLIPSTFMAPLQQLNPTGFLPRVQIQALRRDGQWSLNSANAEFKALSWQAHDALPGVSNMAGWLQASASHGLAYFDTRRAAIDAPDVFREAIVADTLRGGVRWYRQAEQWHIDTGVLAMDNPDAKARVQLALQLPIDDPGSGRLDLLAGIQEGNVASAWRYVPWRAAGDKTLAWLRRALLAGQVSQGGFAYSGGLRRASRDAGQLDMAFTLANASLDYVPGWPVIRELNGQLNISGRDLSITATSARILDAKLSNVKARIPELQASVLSVDADLGIDLLDLDRLLTESPLKAKTAEVAKQLTMRGPAQAALKLVMPLTSGEPVVEVNATLAQARIGLSDSPLQFSDVAGKVSFDLRAGLTGALTGRLWNEPAAINLAAQARAGQWRSQAIDVNAPVSAASLSRWAGTNLTRFVDGRTPVQVTVDIPIARSGAIDLRVNSSLKGLAIKLPAPLTKPAMQSAAFNYVGKLGVGNQRARATIEGMGSVGLSWRDQQLERLLVRVGLPGIAWAEQSGISVEAVADTVQIDDWYKFLAKSSAITSASKQVHTMPAFQRLSLQTKALRAGSENLGAVTLAITRDKTDWLVNADQVQLQSLPKWPPTRVSGRVKPQETGWMVEPLTLSQANADFNGKLSWRSGARAGTQLSGSLTTRSSAALLTQLGLDAGLDSSNGQLTLDMAWPGDPMRFDMAQASGKFAATFEAGRLVGIDRINPLARVFGLVNASNIMRRLRFDFSDVTRKGISFDELNLKGELNRGVLNPATIDLEGPSLNLRGRGSVNMLTREVDQRLRVDIPISSAAAAAGFLAGPIVGGALVAADLLLDKQLARLTSVRYHLTGPWDNLRVDDEALVKPDAKE